MDKLKITLERLMMFFFLTLMFIVGMFVCYLMFICAEYVHIDNQKANEALPVVTKGMSLLIMACGGLLYLFLALSIIQRPKVPKANENKP